MENTLQQFIKEAHGNAITNKFYKCEDCDGTGYKVDNKSKCLSCDGTGENAKRAVYWKLKEENIEFLDSNPTNAFSKDSEQSEISDIILVLLAYCGEMNYDIETHIREKLDFNKTRDYGKEALVKEENEIAESDLQLDIF